MRKPDELSHVPTRSKFSIALLAVLGMALPAMPALSETEVKTGHSWKKLERVTVDNLRARVAAVVEAAKNGKNPVLVNLLPSDALQLTREILNPLVDGQYDYLEDLFSLIVSKKASEGLTNMGFSRLDEEIDEIWKKQMNDLFINVQISEFERSVGVSKSGKEILSFAVILDPREIKNPPDTITGNSSWTCIVHKYDNPSVALEDIACDQMPEAFRFYWPEGRSWTTLRTDLSGKAGGISFQEYERGFSFYSPNLGANLR